MNDWESNRYQFGKNGKMKIKSVVHRTVRKKGRKRKNEGSGRANLFFCSDSDLPSPNEEKASLQSVAY